MLIVKCHNIIFDIMFINYWREHGKLKTKKKQEKIKSFVDSNSLFWWSDWKKKKKIYKVKLLKINKSSTNKKLIKMAVKLLYLIIIIITCFNLLGIGNSVYSQNPIDNNYGDGSDDDRIAFEAAFQGKIYLYIYFIRLFTWYLILNIFVLQVNVVTIHLANNCAMSYMMACMNVTAEMDLYFIKTATVVVVKINNYF